MITLRKEADHGHEWIFNLWIYLTNPVTILLFYLAASKVL